MYQKKKRRNTRIVYEIGLYEQEIEEEKNMYLSYACEKGLA